MIRHFFSGQFLRFLGVGGVAALLHWLTRIGLSLWLPFTVAVALALGVGLGTAFVLNRLLVFPYTERPVQKQLRDFVLTNLAFFPVVLLTAVQLNVLLRDAGLARYTEEIAHAVAIAVPMMATFLIYKFIAFRAG